MADRFEPPYYAVIFSSRRPASADDEYEATAARLAKLAAGRQGFLGIESARDADGFGITVCYWDSEESIAAWKADADHLAAQQLGKEAWYESYEIRIAKVERAYSSTSAGA
ncbi:MAG: antibiotic biosynthesis monooxygenase [Gammaproteobacteria bacterium]